MIYKQKKIKKFIHNDVEDMEIYSGQVLCAEILEEYHFLKIFVIVSLITKRRIALEELIIYTNLLQMLVSIDIATWIPGIYDYHSNGVMVRKSLNCIEINLPTFLGEKIEMPDFKVSERSTKFRDWETRSWKQNIHAGAN